VLKKLAQARGQKPRPAMDSPCGAQALFMIALRPVYRRQYCASREAAHKKRCMMLRIIAGKIKNFNTLQQEIVELLPR